MTQKRIAVLGAGAWGTALAISLANKGHAITLWCRRIELAEQLTSDRQNRTYLPEHPFPETLQISNTLDQIATCDALLNVTPAQHLRSNLILLKDVLPTQTPMVICSKGVEKNSGLLMSEVMENVMPAHSFAILSGPNFAAEVANGLPSATTLATTNADLGKHLTELIGQHTFRPYFTTDVIGAQMGGALKNVLAIACGIVAGAKLGENAKAALLTRGMAEILRLGEKMGARAETLMGLSGFGDLVLTCSSVASRNYSLGVSLGEGKELNDILNARVSVTEGVHTAAAIQKLADLHKIEMPICAAVNKILNEGASVTTAVNDLLTRPFRDEKLAGF